MTIESGDVVIDVSLLCNQVDRTAADLLPLPIWEDIIGRVKSETDIKNLRLSSKTFANFCPKASSKNAMPLKDFLQILEKTDMQAMEYLAIGSRAADIGEYVEKVSDPYMAIMKIVELIATLENDMIRKLFQRDDFQMDITVQLEVRPDERLSDNENFFNGKYVVAKVGTDLLNSARTKLELFKTYVQLENQALAAQCSNNQETYDQVMQALLDDIFGNLPLDERLERLKVGYALYELLENKRKSRFQCLRAQPNGFRMNMRRLGWPNGIRKHCVIATLIGQISFRGKPLRETKFFSLWPLILFF